MVKIQSKFGQELVKHPDKFPTYFKPSFQKPKNALQSLKSILYIFHFQFNSKYGMRIWLKGQKNSSLLSVLSKLQMIMVAQWLWNWANFELRKVGGASFSSWTSGYKCTICEIYLCWLKINFLGSHISALSANGAWKYFSSNEFFAFSRHKYKENRHFLNLQNCNLKFITWRRPKIEQNMSKFLKIDRKPKLFSSKRFPTLSIFTKRLFLWHLCLTWSCSTGHFKKGLAKIILPCGDFSCFCFCFDVSWVKLRRFCAFKAENFRAGVWPRESRF